MERLHNIINHCSINMNSENILKKEDNVIFTNENNMEKKVRGEDNSDGGDVDVDVDVVGDSSDDDEPWKIEDNSSDESDIDTTVYLHGTKRKILVANRKLQNYDCNMFKTFSSDNETNKLENEEESNLPTLKKIKCSKDSNSIEMRLNEIKLENIYKLDQKSINEVEEQSSELNKELILNKNICNVQSFNETNETKFNSSDLLGPSCSTDLPGPSCSTDLHSPLRSLNLPESSKDEELETELLFEFYNKSYINNSFTPKPEENIDTNEDIKVSPIEECNFVKDVSKKFLLNNSNKDSVIENSESYVEDPDIVNPDIMYNINLNEHYIQMDLLVQEISKTSNDVTLLNECMQLTPIPQIEHDQKTFTMEERLNFSNGISEWEYDIDRDDWNKIMVKRAVVFTAHAGFSIANEESLYVLADVAIDYIKKLAIIMKNNFDIQSKASCSDSIDPINNSLQEIGVKGGVKELIIHYQNDVFGRRNKLMKKCQHLQKIIDQYVECTLLDPKIKNQYATKEDCKENNTSEHILNQDDNMLLKEMESIAEEVNIEIQSTNEEIKIENEVITEEIVIANTEIEQIEPIYIENTDIECKIDTDPRNIENINSIEMDIGDRKINHPRTLDTKKMDINLLKPIIVEPINTELESILRSSTNYVESQNRNLTNKQSPELFDKIKIPTWESPSDLENFTDCKITRKLLNPCTVQNSRESLTPHAVEELEANAKYLQKELDEFDEDFKHYEASQKINNISSKSTVSTQCNESSANDNLVSIKTESDQINLINDSEVNSSNAVLSIPVSNENDNCDSDIASYNENDAILMQYNSFIRDLLNLNNTLQIED